MAREEGEADEVSDLLSSAIATAMERASSRSRPQFSSRLLQIADPNHAVTLPGSDQPIRRSSCSWPLLLAKAGAILLVLGGAIRYAVQPATKIQSNSRGLQDEFSYSQQQTAGGNSPQTKGVVLPNRVLREVQANLRHAMLVMKEAEEMKRKALGVKSESESLAEGAEDLNRKADHEMDVAVQNVEKAKQLRMQAMHELEKAKDWDGKATEARKRAKAAAKLALEAQKQSAAETMEASVEASVQQMDDEAKVAAEQKLQDIFDRRLCVDLPGCLLSGSDPKTLENVYVQAKLDSPSACTAWCRKHEECKEAVFDHTLPEGKQCKFFGTASAAPLDFQDSFNSSYCGSISEKDQMLDMIHKAYGAKPWVPEPKACSWVGENCLSSMCCANACVPSEVNGVENCNWYTCYRKDVLSAKCLTGLPPAEWNGTKIGGHPQRMVEKAADGVLTQQSSLYCFSLVSWDAPAPDASKDGEGALAKNAKDKHFGILECDAYQFVNGMASGTELDSLLYAWRQVQETGKWKDHDWVVKVDIDTVFFPERLRWHLNELGAPRGSRVYIRNLEKNVHFSNLQVLTREAAALYYERGDHCGANIGLEGGANYWMLSCLEGIGVDFQTDFAMLGNSRSIGLEGTAMCRDDWAVAFSGFHSVAEWNTCHQLAQDTWEAKQQVMK